MLPDGILTTAVYGEELIAGAQRLVSSLELQVYRNNNKKIKYNIWNSLELFKYR